MESSQDNWSDFLKKKTHEKLIASGYSILQETEETLTKCRS